uniref:DoxX family protein n=1 Tax=Heterorhabditis bacteriophora TaxID=37862 RepID=A0A1I7WYU9_HETBA
MSLLTSDFRYCHGLVVVVGAALLSRGFASVLLSHLPSGGEWDNFGRF